MLREGRVKPFLKRHLPFEARCELVGPYEGDLTVEKQIGRFMGRAARMAWRAALGALAESRLERRDIAVVAGSGTGDVATHDEVQEKLAATKNTRKVSPAVIPRLMGSTVSANLSMALHTTGPSFTVTAACAGCAYNIL